MVWNQIRPDILSGLIWDQTVCKGYQQTTKAATSGERVNAVFVLIFWWLDWSWGPWQLWFWTHTQIIFLTNFLYRTSRQLKIDMSDKMKRTYCQNEMCMILSQMSANHSLNTCSRKPVRFHVTNSSGSFFWKKWQQNTKERFALLNSEDLEKTGW